MACGWLLALLGSSSDIPVLGLGRVELEGLREIARGTLIDVTNVLVFEPTFFETPHHSASCSSHHPGNIFGFRRGKRKEGTGIVSRPRIDSIQYEAVEMRREVER